MLVFSAESPPLRAGEIVVFSVEHVAMGDRATRYRVLRGTTTETPNTVLVRSTEYQYEPEWKHHSTRSLAWPAELARVYNPDHAALRR